MGAHGAKTRQSSPGPAPEKETREETQGEPEASWRVSNHSHSMSFTGRTTEALSLTRQSRSHGGVAARTGHRVS